MGHAVRHLFETTDVRTRKAFAMAGHHAGVMFLGRDLEDAYSVLTGFERPVKDVP
jgi:hypothetical protein